MAQQNKNYNCFYIYVHLKFCMCRFDDIAERKKFSILKKKSSEFEETLNEIEKFDKEKKFARSMVIKIVKMQNSNGAWSLNIDTQRIYFLNIVVKLLLGKVEVEPKET